jgi:hypothetical protein
MESEARRVVMTVCVPDVQAIGVAKNRIDCGGRVHQTPPILPFCKAAVLGIFDCSQTQPG